MRRARSDPIGHKTASHLSSTGIPGEPKQESMRVLSPQPREGIDGPTEGVERTLISSRLGSPEIPVLQKCGTVLWPIELLGAGRLKNWGRGSWHWEVMI